MVSEDLTAVIASDPRASVVSLPLRRESSSRVERGRWPLAAILLPQRGPVAELADAAPLRVRAALTAALFYAEPDGPAAAVVDALTQRVTARAQTYFRPDGSITNW